MPIGRKNIARWVTRIAEKFGLEKEAKRFLAAEDKLLDEGLEKYRKALKGKKVFIAGGELRIFATAEVLFDLGIEIVGFKAHHFDKFVEPVLSALDNVDDVVASVATNQPFELANLTGRLKPDILITHTGGNNIYAKHGLPILPLFGQAYNYMGYSGIFEIARRLNRVLRNNRFNKNLAENTLLPFKKEWYNKDPFTYIKE
jgi:nitrogenase molybdenum-iron protein alpha chain